MPDEWQFSQIRFTAFSADPKTDLEGTFEAFFGFAPESRSTQKAQFLTEVSARRDNVVYRVLAAGPKIDITVDAAAAEAGVAPPALPMLPLPQETRETFVVSSSNILERLREVRRLAVGEHRLLPVNSRVEAYKRMATFLPGVSLDPEGSTDFFYQINRPRKYRVGNQDVKINRLSHWLGIVLSVTVTAGNISQTTPVADAISLTTDVNSAVEIDVSTFNTGEHRHLVETLFAFSSEIAEKGDIP